MDAVLLEREFASFLAEAQSAIVVEDGAPIFDLREARYSISGERGKCLLHLWSQERNIVRRVLEAEHKDGCLTLTVQRFGQSRPQKLEVLRDRDRRTRSARRLARMQYRKLLERVLMRNFPDWNVDGLNSSMDLERSFSPVYTRGLIRRGNSAFAVIGVNQQEPHSAIDGILTFGLLWLDHCRAIDAGRLVVKGLKLFVPPRSSDVVCSRPANLHQGSAEFHVYEVEERDEICSERDLQDRGNVVTRLVRRPYEKKITERFASAIVRVTRLVPEAEVIVLSASEVSLRLFGLEFARVRIALAPGSFENGEEIVFGTGAYERVLDENSAPLFIELAGRLREARKPGGDGRDPLWRMYPERWLESVVRDNIQLLDSRFDCRHVYVQVPAFAAADRAMIDVLTRTTTTGRLTVIELKADEDIHLPLQGLDYWARVKWHQERGEFQQFGYFLDAHEKPPLLSPEPPVLLLVAPALHVHPAVETVLRYFPPQLEWELIGLHERWREAPRVIFRKRPVEAARA